MAVIYISIVTIINRGFNNQRAIMITMRRTIPLYALLWCMIPLASFAAEEKKLPIVYSTKYNIGFFGLENLHSFDSKKYGKVAAYIAAQFHRSIKDLFYEPEKPISDQELLKFHTQAYLDSLKNSSVVARITEVAPLAWLPNFLIQGSLLNSMRYATEGTIIATELAWKNKQYAINLGGGYHHADSAQGGGFCVFGDIQLAMQ